MDAHSDLGTVLQPDEAAIIWDKERGFVLKIPRMEDNDIVPKHVIVLTMLYLKISDEDFQEELYEEYGERTQ
jgi:hypothetical protein